MFNQWGSDLVEYRRGIENGRWQSVWHFHESCLYYPTRSFIIAEENLPVEIVCSKCLLLSGREEPPPLNRPVLRF